jgi:hypothetical protein
VSTTPPELPLEDDTLFEYELLELFELEEATLDTGAPPPLEDTRDTAAPPPLEDTRDTAAPPPLEDTRDTGAPPAPVVPSVTTPEHPEARVTVVIANTPNAHVCC